MKKEEDLEALANASGEYQGSEAILMAILEVRARGETVAKVASPPGRREVTNSVET